MWSFVLFWILNRIWKSGATAKPESLHAAGQGLRLRWQGNSGCHQLQKARIEREQDKGSNYSWRTIPGVSFVCVWGRAYACTKVRWQILSVLFNHISPYFWKRVSQVWIGCLANELQGATFLPPQYWDYSHILPSSAFWGMVGSKFRSLYSRANTLPAEPSPEPWWSLRR